MKVSDTSDRAPAKVLIKLFERHGAPQMAVGTALITHQLAPDGCKKGEGNWFGAPPHLF
jgi:hypothetical protein